MNKRFLAKHVNHLIDYFEKENLTILDGCTVSADIIYNGIQMFKKHKHPEEAQEMIRCMMDDLMGLDETEQIVKYIA